MKRSPRRSKTPGDVSSEWRRTAQIYGTGFITDSEMNNHSCTWEEHVECPDRLTAVEQRLRQENLLQRLTEIPPKSASKQELLLVHSEDYVSFVESTSTMSPEKLRSFSDACDSVYFNNKTAAAAKLAAGCAVALVNAIWDGTVRNGFAAIRPPGHHADRSEACGYCIFNNVAIAGKYARNVLGVQRVLIIDWDIHHGNATQDIFYDDPNVLYISIHRYERGKFWPHLEKSDANFIGDKSGTGFNVNVPLDQIRLTDGDYLRIFYEIVMPLAYEFCPDLILVSAGFDSAVGDPKGEMNVTPTCFNHMTHVLSGLAEGRLALFLEGGYNTRMLAHCVDACIRALLGDAPLPLKPTFVVQESTLRTVQYTITCLRERWNCFKAAVPSLKASSVAKPVFLGKPEVEPEPTELLPAEVDKYLKFQIPTYQQRTCLAFDQSMTLHKILQAGGHPECPERIERIFSKICELGFDKRCFRVPSRMAENEEIQLVHDDEYIQKMEQIKDMKLNELKKAENEWNSIYMCGDSWDCAKLASGNLLECVEVVVNRRVLNGAAIIRPPGHHAESDSAYGFCFINNVAVAAQYARKMLGVGKVLIVDWDVHHGNGVQSTFWSDPNVLYISLHRYDDGRFFPVNEPSNFTDVGEGPGLGYTVNIPFNGRGMGDSEYLTAFLRIIMPIAIDFNPDLVLVSAGFDAALGDPLGGFCLTPPCYWHMTRMLMSLASGRIVLALEGGYNLTSISESMSACVSALLNDDFPWLDVRTPCKESASKTVLNCLSVLSKYWPRRRIEQPTSTDAGSAKHTAAINQLASKLQDSLKISDFSTSYWKTNMQTGLIFEEDLMLKHRCPWDPHHIERPERLAASLAKIRSYHLLERCRLLPLCYADASEIALYHKQTLIDQLAASSAWNEDQLDKLSGQFDDVYVCDKTYEAALLAAGCAAEAVRSVLDGRCPNSMALIRPPGHHAMSEAINGFCIFNNAVLSAKMALDTYKLQRILIVDWDVHHGQGVQRAFYNDPRVLYFSIHRYEHGMFWPYLRESNWDHIGEGDGIGYNVNIPLNDIGMGDAEYLAIFTQLLIPLATEFNPELVLVCAGYDAAIGCPEGLMRVSPVCYAHMTNMLRSLANGRVCVLLEGGYCLDSLSEGVAMTLSSLLGNHCPLLPDPLTQPLMPSLVEVLLNVASRLRIRWKAMDRLCKLVNGASKIAGRKDYRPSEPIYNWCQLPPVVYQTKNKYQPRPAEMVERFRLEVQRLMANKRDEPKRRLIYGMEGVIKEIDDVVKPNIAVKQVISGETRAAIILFANKKRENSAKFLTKVLTDIRQSCSKSSYKILLVDWNMQNTGERLVDYESCLHVRLHESNAKPVVGGNGQYVNFAWNEQEKSDDDYVFAFQHLILPLSYAFAPDVVVLTGNFERVSSQNRHISPGLFSWIVGQLGLLAEGRLLQLVQGACKSGTAASMLSSVIQRLATDKIPLVKFSTAGATSSTVNCVADVAYQLRVHWPYLQSVLVPNPGVGGAAVSNEEAGCSKSNRSNLVEYFQLPENVNYLDVAYSVVPKTDCPHICQMKPLEHININAPCVVCNNIGENWICLNCGTVHCGRFINEHALLHAVESEHSHALSFADLSVWCYKCDAYVSSDAFTPSARKAHLAKFGVEPGQ